MPDILVVEDDENLNRGITFSLKKSGYEVFSAESVKKAKRIASDHNVDVTICDDVQAYLNHIGEILLAYNILNMSGKAIKEINFSPIDSRQGVSSVSIVFYLFRRNIIRQIPSFQNAANQFLIRKSNIFITD